MKDTVIWSKFPFFAARRYNEAIQVSITRTASWGTWGAAELKLQGQEDFIRSIVDKKALYVLLVTEKEEDYPTVAELGDLFQNCIVKKMSGDFHDQLHIYPLQSYDWAARSFFKGNLESKMMPHPVVFVEGKRVDFMAICNRCPTRMGLVAQECSPLHEGCKNLESRQFGFLEKPTKEWFEAHPIDLSKLAPENYREPKKLILFKAFEPGGYKQITLDQDAIQEEFDKRSERAVLAAATLRFKKVVCPGCLNVKDRQYCSRGGGCSTGPYMDDDFQAEVDSVEPWHLHVLCEGKREFQPNDFLPEWSNVVNPASIASPVRWRCSHNAGKPEEHDDRYVRVTRTLCRSIETSVMPYLTICRALGVKPAESMQDMEERFNNGKPFERHMKAAAYLIWYNSVSELHRRGGWHSSSLPLTDSDYIGGSARLRLTFGGHRWRGVTRSIEKMADLSEIPGVHFINTHVSVGRASENAFIRDVCSNTKLVIPHLALRQFFRHHNLAQYDRVIPVEKGTVVHEALKRAWRRYKRAQKTLYHTSLTEQASKSGLKKFVPPDAAWLGAMAASI
jgi:hypothetical protein